MRLFLVISIQWKKCIIDYAFEWIEFQCDQEHFSTPQEPAASFKIDFFPFFFQALEKTIASMQSVLNRTLSSAMAATKKDEKPSPRQLELKLIQSRDEILHPQVTIKATKMMPKA